MKVQRTFDAAVTAIVSGVGAASIPTNGTARSFADIVFVVDESGSMAQEHGFLPGSVSNVQTFLMSSGFTPGFGLTGYGGGGTDNLGHAFAIGSGLSGTAAEFGSAAGGLRRSGSFEDGYSAINYALGTYSFTPGASVTQVLVTDEDRDNGNASLDYSSVLADLQSQNISLVALTEAHILALSGVAGLSADGTDVLVQSGTTFTAVPFDTVVSSDMTVADYVALALAAQAG
ncbi:hypothetical protein PSAL_019830 [Pseudooceanicola algae]|uniref:VWFA domain-containing protein n=2 Tax=Pseudooceanicola algae TaxID=1537215 RepID=A0A418SKJ1_9RHOB|nr:hypothetical protein PSAL_019830 [Pseudooceanicola algae]